MSIHSIKNNKYYESNKEKINQKMKEKHHANPEYIQNRNMINKFGIGLNEYNQILFAQDGKCAICGKHHTEVKTRFCVDHDHKTGQVRGLLCKQCNFGIGMFRDNKEVLKNAIKYLKYHEKL